MYTSISLLFSGINTKALEYLDNNNYFIEEEDSKTITKLLKKLK